MLHIIPYLLYFIGPFAIALLLKRTLNAGWGIFFIGFPLFILSQIGVGLIQAGAGLGGYLLSPSWTPFIVTYIGCLAAGLCEESCRILGFKWLMRRRPLTFGRGMMYAIGHSGMESIIVGLTFLGMILAGAYATEFLDDKTAELLAGVQSISAGWALFLAAQRLFGGLLIHATFSSLVVLFMQRGKIGWLLAAMGLHAANNAVALSLQDQMSDSTFLGLYTVGLFAVYGAILFLLWKKISNPPATD